MNALWPSRSAAGVVDGVTAPLLTFSKARHLLGVSASLRAELTASF
jgi:hypothetical protein